MKNENISGIIPAVCAMLEAGHTVDFSFGGDRYLIEQENNKGWDYISIWRTGSAVQCLGRAMFDIFDGISEDTVRELFELPCIDGRSLSSLADETTFEL